MKEYSGIVVSKWVPAFGERWKNGFIEVRVGSQIAKVWFLGSIVQWLDIGDEVKIKCEGLSEDIKDGFELYRKWDEDFVMVWPPYSKEHSYPRLDPLKGEVLYEYEVLAREARTLEDYISIIELEQYHYASRKEYVALWRCPDGSIVASNISPCEEAIPVAIKGSLPASRFLILELIKKQDFEPRVIGYVRVDPPIPLMHRRIVKDGEVIIEKNIRFKVFPKDWIIPTFWPERLLDKLRKELDSLRLKHGKMKARYIIEERIKEESIKRCNTASARISRVVIHPDYRGDGLGMFAVRCAVDWIKERRIPEMKKRKHIVCTIAMMARYHPFFEKVGFIYLWDTASGRPVLYYPLSEEAKKRITEFIKKDPYASKHGGRLYRSTYKPAEPLSGSIKLDDVSKMYQSVLDISSLPSNLAEVLSAFGVTRRVVQKYVLRDVNLEIAPREVVAVVGLSGAGKTTLLRLILGSALKSGDQKYYPDKGKVTVPANVRVSALLPGELEPSFGNESLLQHIYNKLGSEVAAIEVLNISGLSDAIFYRARFTELSTGQKERAKIASLLAERPNLLIIDEFTAHLDVMTAQRVARKISRIVREHGITFIVATNRPEVLRALSPDKVLYVGYGNVVVKRGV